MPALNNGTIQFFRIYSHLGDSLGEVAWHIVRHPIKTAGIMFTGEKLIYLNNLFGSFGYLSLINPLTLIPAIPIFGQRLLSLRPSETTISFHYQAEMIPFIYISTIFGIKRLLKIKRSFVPVLIISILLVFPALSLISTRATEGIIRVCSEARNQKKQTSAKNEMLDKIPPDASVLASFEFLPKLSNRKHLYSFHHVYSGHYTLSDVSYPDPDLLDFIIFNTSDRLTFGSD